ncbi:hypothetical protein GbCGDNIH6_10011 [Granulibacter bethesdensis]|nr:hypothetical protein GbCGDNIH6_10011 [Granulibacter bethesdensis]
MILAILLRRQARNGMFNLEAVGIILLLASLRDGLHGKPVMVFKYVLFLSRPLEE